MKRSIVLALALFGLTGCASSPSVEQVRWEIQRRFPEARFELEEHVHLGRITMGLVRGLVRMVPGKVDGQEFLSAVRRLDVATYRVSALPDLDRMHGRTHFEDQLARAGWSMTVRAREEDSHTWIFTRTDDDDSLRNLFIVTLEAGELTLVSIDGRLDRALAEAIADRPKEAVRTIQDGGANEPPQPASDS